MTTAAEGSPLILPAKGNGRRRKTGITNPLAPNLEGPWMDDAISFAVVGEENRTPKGPNTQYPWRAYCHLRLDMPNGIQHQATGWFASPSAVVTVAHALAIPMVAGPPMQPAQVLVAPGRRQEQTPFGAIVVGPQGYRIPLQWIQHRDPKWDVAVIRLPAPMPAPGGFGLKPLSDQFLGQAKVLVAGYPDENSRAGILHGMDGTLSAVHPEELEFSHDTTSGQSGGPILVDVGSGWFAAGIINTGTPLGNFGLRINQRVGTWIVNQLT